MEPLSPSNTPPPTETSPQLAPKAQASSPPDSSKPASSETTLDKVSLSLDISVTNRYVEEMSHVPEIRQDKVLRIQQALENGEYSVPATALADSLLKTLDTEERYSSPDESV